MNFDRFADGKLVEHRAEADSSGSCSSSKRDLEVRDLAVLRRSGSSRCVWLAEHLCGQWSGGVGRARHSTSQPSGTVSDGVDVTM